MPYNAGATKAMTAIKKQYGKDWAHVYYGLANKRAGKGLKGKHRGHRAANQAFAKGSHWGGKKSGRTRGRSRSNVGRGIVVNSSGRINTVHRRGGHTVRIRVH